MAYVRQRATEFFFKTKQQHLSLGGYAESPISIFFEDFYPLSLSDAQMLFQPLDFISAFSVGVFARFA